MATVEVVSATTAFHEQKVDEEPKKTEEAAAVEVEEVVAVPAPAPAPEEIKETEAVTTPTSVLEEPVAPSKTEAEVKATEDTDQESVEEVKVESGTEKPVEVEKTKEEGVVAAEQTPVVEVPTDAPVSEPELKGDVEAKPETEDVATATNQEETAKEVDTSAAAAEVEEETKKSDE